MTLKKSEVVRPTLKRETVNVPELGGEVEVQALLMRDRLDVAVLQGPKFSHIAELLARSVVDAEGKSIYSADEWEVFGSSHDDAAFALFKVAQRLSGMGSEDEKKSEAPS